MPLTDEQKSYFNSLIDNEIKSIDAYLEMLEDSHNLFLALPPLPDDGGPARLSEDTESRCVKAVVRELKRNRKRLDGLDRF